MNKNSHLPLLILAILTFTFSSCSKEENTSQDTVRQLHKNYSDGEISECHLNGELVFSAVLDAHDAGTQIFNSEGEQIGNCNYAWNKVDTICEELTDCKVVYRSEDNIWGRPAVNTYNLK